jgi:CBS domain-containing protein
MRPPSRVALRTDRLGAPDPLAAARLRAWRRGARVRAVAAAFEAARGPSPSPWAWLALGAEGRCELAPPPHDQDHALALAAPDAPGQAAWARDLAAQVEGALAAEGIPPCPGGFTAGRWCLGLGALVARARAWLEAPTPEGALEAAAFLDARRVAGALDVSPLRAALRAAPAHPAFLRALAEGALAFRVPGPLRARRAEVRELAPEGLAPLVFTARVFGAAAGTVATGTPPRLAAARAVGLLGADLEAEAVAAFRSLLALRGAGDADGPRVVSAQRAELRGALAAARRLQDCAARRFLE